MDSHDEVLGRLGSIDIYLFDQLQKKRIRPGMKILEVGCGGGRNLAWFLAHDYDVRGVDRDPGAILAAARLAEGLGRDPAGRFLVETADRLSFGDGEFDVVVAIAVLHFADDPAHFDAMLDECWRVLRPGGLFLARLASSIGIEERIEPVGTGRYRIPDGTTRFLVDERRLLAEAERLGARLLDPIRTTVVQGLRAMTTWCLAKGSGPAV